MIGCTTNDVAINKTNQAKQYITILGTAQDGGFPHIGCQKICCANFYNGKEERKSVVSLGLVDLDNQQKWLFEATPDLHTQLADLEQNHLKKASIIDGVFLTHAHIGHYTGLMYFGREALGTDNLPVFAMPKMKSFADAFLYRPFLNISKQLIVDYATKYNLDWVEDDSNKNLNFT